MLHPCLRTGLIVVSVAASLFTTTQLAFAEGGQWKVVKVSGEAWISGDKVRTASASDTELLRAGDSIRTGRNGRVLLNRGAESILVSPNSAITLPGEGKPGMSTVLQQAGTILLDVERKNVKHFEVETPYLAAVVKGTRFRVSLEGGRAKVDVERGRVQVADFKTGDSALVLPGQSARVLANAEQGLQLSGRGMLGQIMHGTPRTARIAPLDVPKSGLRPATGSAPLRPVGLPGAPSEGGATKAGLIRTEGGTPRITAPIGEVTLDIHSATNGVARNGDQGRVVGGRRSTVWSTGDLNPGTNVGKNKAANSGNPVGAAEAVLGAGGAARASSGISGGVLTTTATDAATSTTRAVSDSSNGTNGNGNSNNGNGVGSSAGSNGNGAGGNSNGNGNGGGSGAGSNGNGNGAGGNGNGNNGNGNGNGGGSGA
ncbi:FecR domain-containing protein, partial [Methylobacterium sp. C25]|uniref:FecR family protein n=1 Tax=Methylobacterium sp. C25 TaxID=2721622 RepID=UPI001F1E573D